MATRLDTQQYIIALTERLGQLEPMLPVYDSRPPDNSTSPFAMVSNITTSYQEFMTDVRPIFRMTGQLSLVIDREEGMGECRRIWKLVLDKIQRQDLVATEVGEVNHKVHCLVGMTSSFVTDRWNVITAGISAIGE
jgi:hypothetical protein